MTRRWRGERGDAGPLELVILLPVVLLLFALVVAFGRATTAQQHVQHAAAVGARAAAGAQTAGGASNVASRVVGESLAGVGMTTCGSAGDRRLVDTRRPGHGVGVVRRRSRGPRPVRAAPGIAHAHRVGDRGHRPHARWRVNPRSPRRLRGERGSVSLLVVILAPALLMAAGLVLDGGRQLQARRDAAGAAAAAARAATELSAPELYAGHVDPGLARRRAAAELGLQGVTGSVSVAGGVVTVTVDEDVDYLILPGSRTISSTSSASPQQGVNAAGDVP